MALSRAWKAGPKKIDFFETKLSKTNRAWSDIFEFMNSGDHLSSTERDADQIGDGFVRHGKREDFAQCSRFCGLNGLEVMSACWVKHSFSPHMHDFFAVSLNYGGRGAFDCRGAIRDALPGTSNLIAPGEVHTGHATCVDGWIYRNLYIEPPLMSTLLRSLDWQAPLNVRFNCPLTQDSVLAARLARLFASLAESNSLLQNESFLLSVVARLATHHLQPGRPLRNVGREYTAIRKVQEWLDANCEQNVSIHSLARLADLSPYHVVRAFHKQVGIPPHKYQTILRVHRARKLLISGAAIVDVAYRTGFCDQSHLNRCFKKALGVTPGKYAASGRDSSSVTGSQSLRRNLHRSRRFQC